MLIEFSTSSSSSSFSAHYVELFGSHWKLWMTVYFPIFFGSYGSEKKLSSIPLSARPYASL